VTILPPLEAYRLLAADYDQAPNPLLHLERRMLPALLPDLHGKIVIDAAAGTGYWAAYCSRKGAKAIAADFCWEMIVRAPRPAALADVCRLPLKDECADVTICAFSMGYAPGCLPELRRVTRKGGLVIVSDMHPEGVRHGWTSGFRHNGDAIQVAQHPYSLEDLACRGLELDRLIEPRLGGEERQVFENAGKLAEFEAARHPAVFIARWTRV
jgi:malonyl-CoA O-methyltransferase